MKNLKRGKVSREQCTLCYPVDKRVLQSRPSFLFLFTTNTTSFVCLTVGDDNRKIKLIQQFLLNRDNNKKTLLVDSTQGFLSTVSSDSEPDGLCIHEVTKDVIVCLIVFFSFLFNLENSVCYSFTILNKTLKTTVSWIRKMKRKKHVNVFRGLSTCRNGLKKVMLDTIIEK